MWDKNKPWFEYEKIGISGSWMPAPYQNVFIGSYPLDGATKDWADQFDAIVNVSCTEGALFTPSRPDQRTYWYPVNEGAQWSYAYFFMMFKVIDHHYRKGDKIYIHCHAGAYRSPSIFRLWLVACERKTMEQANTIERGIEWDEVCMKHFSTYQNYILGNVPPNFQEFMERIRNKGIKEAMFVDLLHRPYPLNNNVQVFSKRHDQTLLLHIKNKLLKPFRAIARAFKEAKEAYQRWKHDQIKISPAKGYTVVSSDWSKVAKRRPK